MSADTREQPMDRFGQLRRNFRAWRGQRPFWGGLLTILASIPIIYIPYENPSLGTLSIRLATTAGAGSLIIGVLLVVLGLTMWFQVQSRVFAGVAAILLSLVSLVISNFGGFVVGFLLGLFGGALGVAWAPAGAGRKGAHRGGAERSADLARAETAGPADTVGTGSALDDMSATGTASVFDTDAEADANHGNGRRRAW
jgi:hypothetical protein